MNILGGPKARALHGADNHEQVNFSDDDLRSSQEHRGPRHDSHDLDGMHCLVLRTKDVSGQAIRLPDTQLDWLTQDLAAVSFLVGTLMHHPANEMCLDGNQWFKGRMYRCLVDERQLFRAVVETAAKVVAVFNDIAH